MSGTWPAKSTNLERKATERTPRIRMGFEIPEEKQGFNTLGTPFRVSTVRAQILVEVFQSAWR